MTTFLLNNFSEQKRRAKAAKKAEEKAAKELAQAAQKVQHEAQKPKKQNEEEIEPNVTSFIVIDPKFEKHVNFRLFKKLKYISFSLCLTFLPAC